MLKFLHLILGCSCLEFHMHDENVCFRFVEKNSASRSWWNISGMKTITSILWWAILVRHSMKQTSFQHFSLNPLIFIYVIHTYVWICYKGQEIEHNMLQIQSGLSLVILFFLYGVYSQFYSFYTRYSTSQKYWLFIADDAWSHVLGERKVTRSAHARSRRLNGQWPAHGSSGKEAETWAILPFAHPTQWPSADDIRQD